jgi:hypothetical protein
LINVEINSYSLLSGKYNLHAFNAAEIDIKGGRLPFSGTPAGGGKNGPA